MSDTFQLASSLSVEECAKRLQSALDVESLDLGRLRIASGSRPFAGEVSVDGFVVRQRILGYNSFQTYAVGKFTPTEAGTNIEVQCGAHPGFRLGYALFGCGFTVVVMLVGLPFLYKIFSGAIRWNSWQDLSQENGLLGFIPFCFVPLLFAVGRLSAKGESAALHDFLKQTFEARDAATL